MVVYCTRKLETFIPVMKKTTEVVENYWLAQLLPIGGKKSIIFIEKKTLYCVIIINIQKKDLPNIKEFFLREFTDQLVADGIICNEMATQKIVNDCSELLFFETNNDQRTLGTLRDNILHLKSYISDKPDKILAAKIFARESINNILLGSRKYAKSRELMAAEINI